MKDELFRVGGVVKFNITKDLISEVKGTLAKYIVDFEEKQESFWKVQNHAQLKVLSGAKKVQEVKT